MRRAATLGGEAGDPDRRVANELFHSISRQQDSVPIKPLGSRRLEFTTPHPSPRQPTQRMAVTLTAAALAGELLLAPGVSVPRVFTVDGKRYVIENGAARDMLKAGMIALAPGATRPEAEHFVLTPQGYTAVLGLVGRDRLIDLGVHDPVQDGG